MLLKLFCVGSDEGIYAWVIANYALGSLGGDPLQTTGIVELGGASALCTGLTFSRPFLFVFIGKCSCVISFLGGICVK